MTAMTRTAPRAIGQRRVERWAVAVGAVLTGEIVTVTASSVIAPCPSLTLTVKVSVRSLSPAPV